MLYVGEQVKVCESWSMTVDIHAYSVVSMAIDDVVKVKKPSSKNVIVEVTTMKLRLEKLEELAFNNRLAMIEEVLLDIKNSEIRMMQFYDNFVSILTRVEEFEDRMDTCEKIGSLNVVDEDNDNHS